MSALSKSDYLKRYLSQDDTQSAKKSKKKKIERSKVNNVKIIDENITGWNDDILGATDGVKSKGKRSKSAAQEQSESNVVAVNTSFSNKKMWRALGEDEDDDENYGEGDGCDEDQVVAKKKDAPERSSRRSKSRDGKAEASKVIYRNRKTGARDDYRDEQKIRDRKERDEKNARLTKGLRQAAEDEKRQAAEREEAAKPFARYADDKDLEKHLKDRQRLDDPMARYFRAKQADEDSKDGVKKPTYQGKYLPNRYDIAPGYRWDGVDRSNGYEQKWFENQSRRKTEVQVFQKWSIEDM